MASYWVYFFGADNHISHARDIECDSDADAIARVEEMERTLPVELWTGGKLIKRFEPDSQAPG